MSGLKGIEEVTANINKELKKIKGKSIDGFLEVAVMIREDMENTPPLIPVDTGNLRASWFTTVNIKPMVINSAPFFKGKTNKVAEMTAEHAVISQACQSAVKTSKDPAMAIGFTANYAGYVHEMMGSKKGNKINWKRPNSGPKFFEAALRRNEKKIIQTIQKYATIK